MLWPFIGDLSAHRQKKAIRGREAIAADLLKTGATLFADADEQARLREALQERASEADE